MFRFQHIEYLIGLAAIPLLAGVFYLVLKWKKDTKRKIGDEKLVNQLINSYSSKNFLFKFIFAALALALIIGGIANPQRPGDMENVNRKGVDIVLAMDVSKSMLAEDIKPNRLERARQVVYKLMDKLPNDRIGLVLFAGRAYMQMPLSTDHSAARMYIQQAGPEAVPTQGTVIVDALRMSNTAFNSKERKFKSIILITDGEDHDPQALQLAQQLVTEGVMINTVGIGSTTGAPIIDPVTKEYKKDEFGNTIISKLNESELRELASVTKGTYVWLNDVDVAVNRIIEQLGTIEATALEDNAFRDYKNYFQWLLGAGLLLLVIEFFFPERKLRTA
jgi:Ca-activated chloride channel family protein